MFRGTLPRFLAVAQASVKPAIRGPQPVGNLLTVEVTFAGDFVRIDLGGALDASTAPQLDAWVRRVEESALPVALDLSSVTVVDVLGLTPLLDSAVRRQVAGKPSFILEATSPAVERVLTELVDGQDAGARALINSRPR